MNANSLVMTAFINKWSK